MTVRVSSLFFFPQQARLIRNISPFVLYQLYIFDSLTSLRLFKKLGTVLCWLISLQKEVLNWCDESLTVVTTSFCQDGAKNLKLLWPGEGKLHAKIKCQVFL